MLLPTLMGAQSYGLIDEDVSSDRRDASPNDDGTSKAEEKESRSSSSSSNSSESGLDERPRAKNNQLIRTMLDSHRREMFGAYPSVPGIPLTESVDEYISILRHEELVLKVTPDVHHPALSVIFPLSMQDPELFKCFVVGARALYEWRRNPYHVVHRSRAILYLKKDAISSLQKRLSSPSAHLDDGLVISVAHLMVADACLRDLPSLKSHLRGVRQILSLRGGLGDSPAHLAIRALITTVEFYIALGQYLQISPDDRTAVPTSHHGIEYVRHPFPPEVCRYISTLPTGLAEAALQGHLSVQCIKLLASVAKWAPLVDGPSASSSHEQNAIADDNDFDDDDDDDDAAAAQKTRFCRLFCEPRECSRAAMMLLLCLKRAQTAVGLEHVLCLGLAIAIRHLSGENRTNIFDTAALETLMRHVRAVVTRHGHGCGDDDDRHGGSGSTTRVPDAEGEVLLWLALLINWRTQSAGPLPKADELLDYVLASAFPAAAAGSGRGRGRGRGAGAQSWKKVAVVCRKFWWFDRFHAEWEKCWVRASERLQQRQRRGPALDGRGGGDGNEDDDCDDNGNKNNNTKILRSFQIRPK